MTSKFKLVLCVAALVLLGSGMAIYKAAWLEVPFWRGQQVNDWQIESKVTFFATGKKVKVRLSLPDQQDSGWVGGSASLGYNSYLAPSDGRNFVLWTHSKREGPQALYYWVRVREGDASTVQPLQGPAIPPEGYEMTGTAGVAATAVVERVSERSAGPDSLFVGLCKEVTNPEPSQEMELLKRKYGKLHRDRLEVMLGLDLLRLAGVPARLCHGVRLTEERGIQPPHLLVEYHDGMHWKVRDIEKPAVPLDPQKWFVWHRGGGALLEEVSGGENSRVSFEVDRVRVPQSTLTNLGKSNLLVSTIMGLPQSERSVFRYLVLIPLGAFVVVLLRNIVGVPTLGTFMPVLIALALLEIDPVWSGLLMFSVLVGVGLWFRFLLSRLNLLVVPRVAACVVIVTLLMIVMSVVAYRLGYRGVVEITLFPMIIIAWTIERMSIIWEEEGSRNAIVQVGGSLFVAVCAFLCMKIGQIQYWAFHFPELL
ncbi:MAG: UUP1 family membrane protein, partial [Akkermansiaceae bacterium]|nr:UUP1 family membrane protein [Akkermansiaceae bacterium]